MAKSVNWSSGESKMEAKPKKTRQGMSMHTKFSATSRNNGKKRYRGQGK